MLNIDIIADFHKPVLDHDFPACFRLADAQRFSITTSLTIRLKSISADASIGHRAVSKLLRDISFFSKAAGSQATKD